MSVRSRLTVGELMDWLSTKPRDAIVDPDKHCVGIPFEDGNGERLEFNYRWNGNSVEFWKPTGGWK